MTTEMTSEQRDLAADQEVQILDQWDSLRKAIDRVETALPQQMSAAIEKLTEEKLKTEDLLVRKVFRR